MGKNGFWLGVLGTQAITILALSFCSGYESLGLPWTYRWAFTPLGLWYHSDPESLGGDSVCRFAAHWKLNFDYAWLFLKTLLLELPFYFLALRKQLGLRAAGIWATGNFLTHPMVCFGIPCLITPLLPAILVAELFAPILEALVLWRIGKLSLLSSLVWSFLANLFSWQFGIFF